MQTDQIERLFDDLGRALSTGALQEAASYWQVPALVLSDNGAVTVADSSQIEKFFGQAAEWYRERGLTSTRPEIEGFDVLSDKLVAVYVRWPAFDAADNEQASERSFYILQEASNGQLHIRVALTRTK